MREPTRRAHALSNDTRGLLFGGAAVLAFSFTLPATRVAVAGLGATFVGLGRGVVAALLAGAVLLARCEHWPPQRYLGRLAVVALGVVVGFPLLSALALRSLPAGHSAVVVGLVPAATAVMAVVRGGERPSAPFWMACGGGVAAALFFAAAEGSGRPRPADGLLLGAVLAAGVGYAEGGALARELGSWQVICWALILAAPFVAIPTAVAAVNRPPSADLHAWLGFAYVAGISMFLGFFAWYRGLALGGIARVGQVQLVQPVLTLLWSVILLGERIDATTIAPAIVVIASAALSRRTRVTLVPAGPAPPLATKGDAIR